MPDGKGCLINIHKPLVYDLVYLTSYMKRNIIYEYIIYYTVQRNT